MNFKVGQRVIAVANGFNYGGSDDPRGSLFNHDYAIGWKGTMGDDNAITFDNGRVIRGCDNNSLELINESEEETMETNAIRGQATQYKVGTKVEIVHLREPKNYPSDFIGKQGIITEIRSDTWGRYPAYIEIPGTNFANYLNWYAEDEFKVIPETPQLAVGSKVTCVDGSYSYGFVDGKMSHIVGDINKGVHEITAVNMKLPSGYNGEHNDTIIRRISDGKVYFVRQEFLKKYVALPKFKRGDYIEYCSEYFRIAKVNDDGTYVITSSPSRYDDGSASIVAKESELSEVTQ